MFRTVSSKYYKDESRYGQRGFAVALIVALIISCVTGLFFLIKTAGEKNEQQLCQSLVMKKLTKWGFTTDESEIVYKGKTSYDPMNLDRSGYGRFEVFIPAITSRKGTVIGAGYYILYTYHRRMQNSSAIYIHSKDKGKPIMDLEDL